MSARLLVVCDDLFFWARIHAAATAKGRTVRRIGDEAAMESEFQTGGVATVLADLGSGAIDLIGWAARWKSLEHPPRLVGFGSHVDVESLQRARDAGFDEVLARSRFTQILNDLV